MIEILEVILLLFVSFSIGFLLGSWLTHRIYKDCIRELSEFLDDEESADHADWWRNGDGYSD